jgi:hypothetical protein
MYSIEQCNELRVSRKSITAEIKSRVTRTQKGNKHWGTAASGAPRQGIGTRGDGGLDLHGLELPLLDLSVIAGGIVVKMNNVAIIGALHG